jgi:hypothetical protein
VLQLVAKLISPHGETPPETTADLDSADVAIIERFLRRREENAQ